MSDDSQDEDATVKSENATVTRLGQALLTSKAARVGEIVAVFGVAFIVILGASPWVGENPLALQGVAWVANVLMLLTVWLGLRLRGQGWAHFGLRFGRPTRRTVVRTVLLSIVVLVVGVAGFLVGGVVAANIVSIPEGADLSGYNYLSGNLPMLIFALLAVYIGSSFGEEVVYRAFLINRIAELGSGSKWAWSAAVVISSVVFGLAHGAWGPAGMVQTGFMGLAMALCYLAVGRNLWVTILAHVYMDTILFVPQYFAEA